MTYSATTASTSLFKGGPTLLDLMVDVSELRITVNGPQMLFEKLTLVTTLSAFDGCTVERTRELADSLEGTIHCGLAGVQRAQITVQAVRSGGHLEIGLGPPSMYQSELVLRTRTGETFRELLPRLLAEDSSAPFIAGLHAVTATGHLEHHHGGGHDHAGDQGGGSDGGHHHDHAGNPGGGSDARHLHGDDPDGGNTARHHHGDAPDGGNDRGHHHDHAAGHEHDGGHHDGRS